LYFLKDSYADFEIRVLIRGIDSITYCFESQNPTSVLVNSCRERKLGGTLAKSKSKKLEIGKIPKPIIAELDANSSKLALEKLARLSIDQRLERIAKELDEIRDLPVADEKEKIFKLLSIMGQVVERVDNLVEPFPKNAEQWKQRDKSLTETPYSFSMRVYGKHPLVHLGLIRKLDRSLAEALSNPHWEDGKSEAYNIPSNSELNQKLEKLVLGKFAQKNPFKNGFLDILLKAIFSTSQNNRRNT